MLLESVTYCSVKIEWTDIGVFNAAVASGVFTIDLHARPHNEMLSEVDGRGKVHAHFPSIERIDKGERRMEIVRLKIHHFGHELLHGVNLSAINPLFLEATETIGVVHAEIHIPTHVSVDIEPEAQKHRYVDKVISIVYKHGTHTCLVAPHYSHIYIIVVDNGIYRRAETEIVSNSNHCSSTKAPRGTIVNI